MTNIPITNKECEALFWGIAQIGDRPERVPTEASDPLFILDKKWDRDEIVSACNYLEMVLGETKHIPAILSPLQQDILRCCIENTSWITAYITDPDGDIPKAMITECRSTLRSLAAKLDCLGVAVNFIPSD